MPFALCFRFFVLERARFGGNSGLINNSAANMAVENFEKFLRRITEDRGSERAIKLV
jgi:hypothetical protein